MFKIGRLLFSEYNGFVDHSSDDIDIMRTSKWRYKGFLAINGKGTSFHVKNSLERFQACPAATKSFLDLESQIHSYCFHIVKKKATLLF